MILQKGDKVLLSAEWVKGKTHYIESNIIGTIVEADEHGVELIVKYKLSNNKTKTMHCSSWSVKPYVKELYDNWKYYQKKYNEAKKKLEKINELSDV